MAPRSEAMQNTLTTFDIEGSATGDIQVYIPALRPGQAPLFDSMDEFKKVVLESATPEMTKRGGVVLDGSNYYMMNRGKRVSGSDPYPPTELPTLVTFVVKLVGGKGGFGSMLRAIGAQIEKTTNRDACRDLSGRRLRDLDEDKKVQKWYDAMADRKKKRAEAKKDKLEKLKVIANGPALPKIADQTYLKKREDIEESLYEAVNQGFAEKEKDNKDALQEKEDKDEEKVDDKSSGRMEIPAASKYSKVIQSSTSTSFAGTTVLSAGEDDPQPGSSGPSKASAVKRTMMDEDFDLDSESDSEEGEEDADAPSNKKKKVE